MTEAEKVALALLVTLGATAVDSGMMEDTKKKFEQRFGVAITDDVIVSVINKVKGTLDGFETVVIGGE